MDKEATKFRSLFLMLLASFGLTFGVTAQEKQQNRNQQSRVSDLYVVSAKAGGVNYVVGKVYVKRNGDNTQTRTLAKKDELNDLDTVLTAETGKVEVLLNPGSFLRLAENSEIEFTNVSSDNLRLSLNRGSALIETTTFDEDGAGIVILTPAGEVAFAKSGIYRINVSPDKTVAISVWKGAAKSGGMLIKARRKVVLQNNLAAQEIAKLEKDSRDDFELWSKDRAKELVKANDSLRQRELSRALLAFNRNDISGFGNNFGNRSGAWVFDSFRNSYCFLPFAGAWNSPYGFGYNNFAWGPGSAGFASGRVFRQSGMPHSDNSGAANNFPGAGGSANNGAGGSVSAPSNPMPSSRPSPEMRPIPSRMGSKTSPIID